MDAHKRFVFTTMGNKGVLSIEAALTFPLFMIGMILLLLLLRDISRQDKLEMELLEIAEKLAYVEIDSTLELGALSLAAVSTLKLEAEETLIPIEPLLYSDGRYTVRCLWSKSFPIVGVKTRILRIDGRGLYLGDRGLSEREDQLVYVTETGHKYHLKACRYLARSAFEIKKSQALKKNYQPCWICIGGLALFERAPEGGLSPNAGDE